MGERQQEKAVEGRGLKAQPVVELHQEHVGRGIEKHLVTEIVSEVERGVGQIDEPRLAPDEEQGGAGPVLPSQHRVRAEGAHTTVGVRELEAVGRRAGHRVHGVHGRTAVVGNGRAIVPPVHVEGECTRSEEHTSELQSRPHLVCRLLLEKKKKYISKGRGWSVQLTIQMRPSVDWYEPIVTTVTFASVPIEV